jgi:hypothetical protein
MTADRLQLAFDDGLTIDKLAQDQHRLAVAVARQSLESMKVVTLARMHDLQ